MVSVPRGRTPTFGRTPLPQKEIADRLGTRQAIVSLWLTGKAVPSDENLIQLARVLGREPEELLVDLFHRRQQARSRDK